MSRRGLAAVLLAAGAALGAAEVNAYAVNLRIQPDGSARGRVQLHLHGVTPGPFDVPFGVVDARDLVVAEGPRGTEASLVPTEGQPRIRLAIPEAPAGEFTVTLAFTTPRAYARPEPAKGRGAVAPVLLRHAFVNTLPTGISDYRFEALLPAGAMAQAIREQLPKPGKTESDPRVRLGLIDGCQAATLRVGPLRQGDDTAMTVEITSTRRSWGWLLAGCALALLYLVRFRDLVAPAPPAPRP